MDPIEGLIRTLVGFVKDFATYDQRMVARADYDWGFISTAAVSDGRDPYETAVEHAAYNMGKCVIVESYQTREAALEGHARWVAKMEGELPDTLTDCANSSISQVITEVDGNMDFPLGT
jgi:hypothetical protein